ncbi:hypothetical protein PHYBLDRAFT_159663 [Phycomyces blakesleeanus NRRL 1555(-)]|uniref:Uncharacterized protein n=1 Tax=Phycomyces blakesleeanus (strain ATCC 8743b / DSM 1359 / FGSC 10004 / NBRC 33097 / NRRL 1555) TaxID=763407 RepID=A0A162NK01_PHYB8|nr:hypothetical protein PHYBLDRAFT_159663 [Phycomyces blakesleeanus NRRL 1555(-)]OAD70374.1 hypothetical protein PHYBLDRAFT_159663 [Phycomyces blakesleeanus NRRL 1555(-)]|eukprot:XP_018288414.1 hypothetical protein PHYBLDRAFT_159663 [Phycomyces blakesleeanus NRRL 1555(-)]
MAFEFFNYFRIAQYQDFWPNLRLGSVFPKNPINCFPRSSYLFVQYLFEFAMRSHLCIVSG